MTVDRIPHRVKGFCTSSRRICIPNPSRRPRLSRHVASVRHAAMITHRISYRWRKPESMVTWLLNIISTFHLKNRRSGVHGGVGLNINNTMKYKALTDVYQHELEVLWAHLRHVWLPRGLPCIVLGTVYHTLYPDGASDAAMIDYLISSLTTIEGGYSGCGTPLSGDFNRLNISRLEIQLKLK